MKITDLHTRYIKGTRKQVIALIVVTAYLLAALFLHSTSTPLHFQNPRGATSEGQAVLQAISIAETAPAVLAKQSKTSNCHVQGPLPDPECSPGALFPKATTAEICVSGYTKKVRNVSASLKKKMYAAYDISYPQKTGSYEMDHLIPLELGGSNEPANLFPEANDPAPGFPEKDVVENFLHQETCAGRIPLDQAQRAIALDWTKIYQSLTSEEIEALKDKFRNWADAN